MPAREIEPPELARLVDVAERPRVDDWSLRAALVRYAQPEPVRVEKLLEVVRRLEVGLKAVRRVLEKEGPDVWAALGAGDTGGTHGGVVGLLEAATELDRLGDVLAAWALDPSQPRPDADVDAVTADVAARLDALGVPREERTGPPRRRSSG